MKSVELRDYLHSKEKFLLRCMLKIKENNSFLKKFLFILNVRLRNHQLSVLNIIIGFLFGVLWVVLMKILW